MSTTHAARSPRHAGEYVPLYLPRRRGLRSRVSDMLALIAVVLIVSSAAGLLILRAYSAPDRTRMDRATADATIDNEPVPVNGKEVVVKQLLIN